MKRIITVEVLAVSFLVAACGDPSWHAREAAGASAAPTSVRGQAGYALPPQVQQVSLGRDGSLEISGRAAHDGRVRALTAQGSAYGAATGVGGSFLIDAPASSTPLLIALSADDSHSLVSAPGFLFIPPDAPGRAVMLIPGAASHAVGGRAGLITAADYDAGGGGGVCGAAPAGQMVSIYLDGALVARTVASPSGLYAARLGDKPIPAGDHEIRVTTAGQSVSRILRFSAAAPPAGQSFSAVREDDGWRVNWTAPFGGSETTFVFTPRAPS